MSIHIPGEYLIFVNDLVEGGAYPSADAVVTDALRLLRLAQKQREALKAEIARGIEEGDRGDRRPLDLEEVLAKARRMQAEMRGEDG
jgi:putative addiction module CopG family antidote